MAENLPQTNSFDKNKYLRLSAVGLFFAGLFVLAFGLGLFLFGSRGREGDIQIISATDSAKVGGEIVVDVDGAVVKPGVYHLQFGARLEEAVAASGGLTQDADRGRINLAAKVTDGQKVYIPAQGEEVLDNRQQVTSSSTNLININTASESQLDKLPGIGPVTAGKIINLRPYGSLEELLSKKAVTSSVYQKIKDLVTF